MVQLTQSNGQALVRLDAGERGVERQLADGNAHAACSQVAQTQDTLAVCHYDGTDIVFRPGWTTIII